MSALIHRQVIQSASQHALHATALPIVHCNCLEMTSTITADVITSTRWTCRILLLFIRVAGPYQMYAHKGSRLLPDCIYQNEYYTHLTISSPVHAPVFVLLLAVTTGTATLQWRTSSGSHLAAICSAFPVHRPDNV